MRLLYITNARIPTEKAHGWQIMKMCEAFVKNGLEVELYVPKRNNEITEDAFSYYGMGELFSITYLSTLDLVKYGRLGFYIQVITFALSGLYTSLFTQADALYSRDELSAYFISFFKKNVYYEMHDYPKSHTWLYKGLFKRVAKIISTNQIKKDRLVKEFKVPEQKIVVQRNGIDSNELALKFDTHDVRHTGTIAFEIPTNKKCISYIGKYKTFGKGKGVSGLIEAFSELRKKRSDIFLMLVGIEEREKEELHSLFDTHQLVWNVDYRYQGHVHHGLLFEYLQGSDVLVMNYPNTEHYAQFMSPLKMFEYMASGTPIVSSDLPSIREVLNEDNALLVEPDNTHTLAQGIQTVLSDNAFAKKIARKAQQDVQQYDWNIRAQKIISHIKAI